MMQIARNLTMEAWGCLLPAHLHRGEASSLSIARQRNWPMPIIKRECVFLPYGLSDSCVFSLFCYTPDRPFVD
jgi:hypothetical protein